MRNNFILLFFLLSLSFLFSQNRKGSFYLTPNSSQHELYVSFLSDDFLNQQQVQRVAESRLTGFKELQEKYSITLERGLPLSEEGLKNMAQRALKNGKKSTNIYKLQKIYKVKVPHTDNKLLYELAGELEKLDGVEYVSLMSLEPVLPPFDIAPTTENYENRQGYIEADPGVNMRYAWDFLTEKGITPGQGIRVRDIEYGFNKDHEEFNDVNAFIAPGMTLHGNLFTPNYSSYIDHGTAVLGEIFAHKGSYGVSGMAYGASEVVLYPEWTQENGYNRLYAVIKAVDNSSNGDIIIFEMQTAPREAGKYVPAEYNNLIWDQVKAATDAGTIVVAAAGNGSENLDDPYYEEYMNRGDSGAVIVGAGSNNTNHDKLFFSTYGSRVNVQGWGDGVFTSGYGNFINVGGDPNQSYTASFSGTSSATPIVASCIIVLQSYYHHLTGRYLSPYEMRDLLIDTGISQGTSSAGTHIGPFPDMKAAIEKIDRTLGIEENPTISHNKLILSPNPVKEKVFISMGGMVNENKLKVEIYSLEGKLIHSEIIKNNSYIDIQYIPKSIYIIKVNNGKNSFSKKIIKE